MPRNRTSAADPTGVGQVPEAVMHHRTALP